MSLATQIQDVTNSLRMNQKKLFDYVKKYNSVEGGEFLRLSEEKMLEMKDTEIEENKNELELMEELAQERLLEFFFFFFFKILKLLDFFFFFFHYWEQSADCPFSGYFGFFIRSVIYTSLYFSKFYKKIQILQNFTKFKFYKILQNFTKFYEIYYFLSKKIFLQRDEEINKLVETINELTKIFKQMNQLVIDQGTILDRIDFNIEDTLVQTKKGNEQLTKANEYQKSNRGTYCIVLLSALIFFFLMILIVKYTR